jgi:hypothetical protein
VPGRAQRSIGGGFEVPLGGHQRGFGYLPVGGE